MGPDFWLRHAYLPGFAFICLAWAGACSDLDIAVESAWAFDAAIGQFIGAGAGEWWTKDLLHTAGGLVMRTAGAGIVLSWITAWRRPSLAHWRRAASYTVAATAAAVAIIGLLKATTNVDCPWSLDLFGGSRPYVHLFADRSDALPRARCFPGGHSSSGFMMFALYFALRERNRTLARLALTLALVIGALFAFGQQARGAHFLSHDLWSAAIVWFTCLGIYVGIYRGRLWPSGMS